MKKDIVRSGDFVKIVNPTVVIRCGLPKTTLDYRDWALQQYKKLDLDVDGEKIKFGMHVPPDESLIRYLARHKGYLEHFGGMERSLYTVNVPELVGQTGYVWALKTVYTGQCYGAQGGYDYWTGDYDYEPGGLDNKKCHRIAWVCFDSYLDVHDYLHNVKTEPHFREYWKDFVRVQGVPLEVTSLEKTGGNERLGRSAVDLGVYNVVR